MDRHIVIIGAGEAGGRAAFRLREQGYPGRLTLLGDEGHLPFERPVLSKGYLTTAEPLLPAYLPAPWYEQNGIDIIDARVDAIDPSGSTVRLRDGTSLAYSQLLICTGSSARRLAIPGEDLDGVTYLRHAREAVALKRRLALAEHVLVVGGGFIGLEVAASARALGLAVTVVEAAPRLMARAVPPAVSETFAAIHVDQGVSLRFGVHPVEFRGEGGLAEAVLSDGSSIAAQVAVVGVGVVPRVELAAKAGLALADGIVVDEVGRTSAPAIFAAGDAVTQFNRFVGRRVRLETWQNARDQAEIAADAMLGLSPREARAPWMWTDQYEHNLQILGLPDCSAPFIIRGDLMARSYSMFQVEKGRLSSAICVDRGADMAAAKKLVATGISVEPNCLADEGAKLRALAKGQEMANDQ